MTHGQQVALNGSMAFFTDWIGEENKTLSAKTQFFRLLCEFFNICV